MLGAMSAPRFDPIRQSDAYRSPTRLRSAKARRILVPTAPGADPDWLTVEEIEGYAASTAEELGALRDRELWGDAPLEEG